MRKRLSHSGTRIALAQTSTSILLLVCAIAIASNTQAQDEAIEPIAAHKLQIELPAVALTNVPFSITIRGNGLAPSQAITLRDAETQETIATARVPGANQIPHADTPVGDLELSNIRLGHAGTRKIVVEAEGREIGLQEVHVLFAPLALLPPFLAIALALWARRVVLSLALGIGTGALLTSRFDPLTAFSRMMDDYVVGAVADEDHAAILVFTLLLGGMVGVISASGGGQGLATFTTRFASNRKRGQLATWFLGLLIFFDDYANALLVGSSMRPVTDRLRISREKLAFLIDATAAPVSSLAVISSWVGVEIGYIADQYEQLGIAGDPYWVFLETLPYRFYPWLMLFFGALVAISGRDFGAMVRAEAKPLRDGPPPEMPSSAETSASKETSSLEGAAATGDTPIKPRPMLAAIPILVVVAVAIVGLVITGVAAIEAGPNPDQALTIRAIIGNANSLRALLWASTSGCIAAIMLTVATGTMPLSRTMESWLSGIHAMTLACVILVLAWALGHACKDVQTAQFIIQSIGQSIDPRWLPGLVFLIAGGISFATGTSWGTMAILFPLVVPLVHGMQPGDHGLMLGAISSILAGAVWGDHCSPISDTTIMSSLAAGCDHIDHVRTQLPYAMIVGIVSLVLGDFAVAAGLYPAWVGLIAGALMLVAIVFRLGKTSPNPEFRSPRPPGLGNSESMLQD